LNNVAKPELGTKRLCGSCGAKFYDLSKDPIVCPKCGTVFQVVVPVSRARPDAAGRAAAAAAAGVAAAAAAAAAAKAKEAEVVEQEEGAEFVSLEDADAEAQGKKTEAGDIPDTDDIEVEEDESMDDAAFIQEDEEEGDPDVTDIVGDGITKEDET
jgi:uncharacterized protein (TIGR02300 family)